MTPAIPAAPGQERTMEHNQAETPMADHVSRFWRLIADGRVRILVDMFRPESFGGTGHWDSASFPDDVAKAIVAEHASLRRERDEAHTVIDGYQRDIERLTAESDACHDVWRTFRTKLATVIPDIDSWPLFHGAEAIIIQLGEATRRAESAERDKIARFREAENRQSEKRTVERTILQQRAIRAESQLAAAQAREAGLVREIAALCNFLEIALDVHDDEHGSVNPETHPQHWTVQARKRLAEALAGTAQGERRDTKEESTVDRAIEIPMNDCGLSINCGRDGTWLHFSTASGLHASFNVEAMEANGGFMGRALRDWCSDRQKQAKQIHAAPAATPPGGERQSAHRVCMREVLTWINERREEGCQITAGQANKLLTALASAVERDRAPGGEPTQAGAGGEDDLAKMLAAAVNSPWTALADHCGISVDYAPGTKAFWRKIARAMLPALTRARGEGRAQALREAIAAQPCTAENPNEDTYQRGKFDGVMEYQRAIRRLFSKGQPAPAGEGT